ncbi:mechanosensitive ion channel family protein [bacterium]|nr:mechanosensitive ion channel family protein [bacterium]
MTDLRKITILIALWLLTPCLWAQATPPTPLPDPPQVTFSEVKLHQVTLFRIQGLGQICAEDRQQLLEERLSAILEKVHPPFEVRSSREGDNEVLSCQGHYLVTVTPVDAEAASVDVHTLAGQWSRLLNKGLYRAYLENSDEYYKYALWNSGWAIVLACVLHPLIRRICLRYLSTPGLSLRSMLWLSVFAYCLHQYPRTRFLSLNLERYALQPFLLLAAVVIGCLLMSWVIRRATRHYFIQTERVRSRRHQQSPRWRQRLHMVRDATQFVSSALMIVLAVIIYFSLLDMNVGAILAGAGFLGVGLGFAAQDVLKDYTAGVNIMVEDQFGAGDVVTLGELTGVVEHFTLRVTQIRDMAGSLITIPNSHIRVVQNLSNLWSQVDLTVPVALDADLRRALLCLEVTANGLRLDWPDKVLDAAQILGVERIGPYSADLRLLLRTAPQQQFSVRRELLLRVIEAFRRDGIEIPVQMTRLISTPQL